MSDHHPKSDEDAITMVDITSWIDRARSDPQAYLERQATEVFLTAIALAPTYKDKIFLKGGILMGIRYDSPRQTADLDFTTTLEPNPDEISDIRAELDDALPRANMANLD